MWSDAGVEGAHRFLRRLWAFAQAHADAVASGAGAFDWRSAAAAVKAARREIHLTLKQANYDYERIQYNTVVSAGMKMLNALEAVPDDAAGAAALAARGPVDPAARALSVVPHTAGRCGTTSASPASSATCSTRRGRRSTRRRSRRTRSSSCCRSTASCAASSSVPAAADRAAIEAARARERGSREARGRRAGEEGRRRAGTARQCRRLSVSASASAGSPAASRGATSPLADRPSPDCSSACPLGRARRLRLPPARRRHLSVRDALRQRAGRRADRRRAEARARRRGGTTRRRQRRRTRRSILDITARRRRQAGAVAVRAAGACANTADQARALPRCTTATATTGCRRPRSSIRRTYTFNESEVLAREHEEARLLREMQTDAVQQIVRRLQAAKKPRSVTRARHGAPPRPARRASRAHARTALRRPRRRAAARDRGRRRDPRGGARAPAATSARCSSSSRASSGTRSSRRTPTWRSSARASSIDLRIPSGKPGVEGAKALEAYAANPNPDSVMLITLPRLDRATQSSAWFAALARGRRRGRRLSARRATSCPRGSPRGSRGSSSASRRRRSPSSPIAAKATCSPRGRRSRSSGSLLPEGELAHDAVERAVADVARYDVFELSEAWLARRRGAGAAHPRRARSGRRRHPAAALAARARTARARRGAERGAPRERRSLRRSATRASGASAGRDGARRAAGRAGRRCSRCCARSPPLDALVEGHRPRQRVGRAARRSR